MTPVPIAEVTRQVMGARVKLKSVPLFLQTLKYNTLHASVIGNLWYFEPD